MKGMRIVLVGMALLWVTFFLPHVEACSETISPVMFTKAAVEEEQAETYFYVMLLCMPFVYVFLVLPVLVAERLVRRVGVKKVLTWGICVLSILAAGAPGVTLRIMAHEGLGLWPDLKGVPWNAEAVISFMFLWLLLGSLLVLVGAALKAPPTWKLPICFLVCGGCGLVYFMLFILFEFSDTHYGLWLSALACALVTVGGGIELMVQIRAWRRQMREASEAPPGVTSP